MKKGFTLIELLAVILILGIIALIAIPTVNNIIKEARTGAFLTSSNNMMKQIEQAKELAAIADVVKGENGIQVFLKNDILFDVNSAVLSTDALATLKDLNRVLKKYPKNRIVVQGFTDSTGTAEYNKQLSTQRAQAVYNYLLSNGLKTLGITYIGYGESNPVASNDTEAGRAKNRRVVLAITANEKDIQ